jgi:hypothetical protein
MHRSILAALWLLAVTSVSSAMAAPIGFEAVTLVSSANDPDLVNPWGLTSSSNSAFWVGANGTGKSLIYDSNGVRNPNLTVKIPGDGSVTGVTFNTAGGFNNDLFLSRQKTAPFRAGAARSVRMPRCWSRAIPRTSTRGWTSAA